MADIQDCLCGACRDELQAMDPAPEWWLIEQTAMKRVGDLGLCNPHAEMVGHSLYRMLKAGGFLVEEE